MKYSILIFNFIFLVLLNVPSKSYSQTIKNQAEKVLSYLYPNGQNEPSVKEVRIMVLGDGFNKKYTGKWLEKVTVDGNSITFYKDESHSVTWYLKDAKIINKSHDLIYIRI